MTEFKLTIKKMREIADRKDAEQEILTNRGFYGKPEELIILSMKIGTLIGESRAYRTCAEVLEKVQNES